MLRVLLDTNQLVSSLLTETGLQRQLIDHWRDGSFLLLLAQGQAEEVGEVLARPKITRKYKVLAEDRSAFVDLLRKEALVVPLGQPAGACRDADDDRLLGCATAAGADYLVTGDSDLLVVSLFGGVRILTARDFLSVLAMI